MNTYTGSRIDYQEHIQSRMWKRLRSERLELAGYRCEQCGTGFFSGLECHHLTYERFGKESINDLMMLCKSCHKEAHHKEHNDFDEDMQQLVPRDSASWEDYIDFGAWMDVHVGRRSWPMWRNDDIEYYFSDYLDRRNKTYCGGYLHYRWVEFVPMDRIAADNPLLSDEK